MVDEKVLMRELDSAIDMYQNDIYGNARDNSIRAELLTDVKGWLQWIVEYGDPKSPQFPQLDNDWVSANVVYPEKEGVDIWIKYQVFSEVFIDKGYYSRGVYVVGEEVVDAIAWKEC